MSMTLLHPDLDRLAAFTAGELDGPARDRVAAHLSSCVRCQNALRFVRRLAQVADALPAPELSPELLERTIAARQAGERILLQLPAAGRAAPRHRRIAGALAAVAATIAVAAILMTRTTELAAVSEQSELRLAPAHPRAGADVRVSYRPSAGLFAGRDSLVLRARLRTVGDRMYTAGIAGISVRPVGVLRAGRGGWYEGSFRLPDSVVYAALAVEDPSAARVDDRDGRPWEVLTFADETRPSAEALEQRVNDMMGRNWEEGYATAKRLAALHPDHFSGWLLREFFERALYGSAADSIAAAYRARLAQSIARAKASPAISYDDLGSLYFRAYSTAGSTHATAADTAELRYWWDRLQREYPRHEQIAQQRALSLRTHAKPRAALDTLERLYPQLVPIRGPGGNLFYAALTVARTLGDQAAVRRWTERRLAGIPDSARQIALTVATLPTYRAEGMAALRSLLAAPAQALVPIRALGQNAAEYQRRVADERRSLLAALGQALIADGQRKAGLDTLDAASHGGWNVAVFRDAREAYLAAGDTAAATGMSVRLVADPRTPAARADSFAAAGRARLGAAAWDSALVAARREMHRHLLDASSPRALRGEARVADAAGKVRTVRELAGKRPAVVIFWSRFCGYAVDALPAINETAERLRKAGTPVLLVVDEPPSRTLSDFLAAHDTKVPVQFDVQSSAATAFNNFGTPSYYVLDDAGRIRFRGVDDEPAELIAQVEALQQAP